MLRLATWPFGAATHRICVYGMNTRRKTKPKDKSERIGTSISIAHFLRAFIIVDASLQALTDCAYLAMAHTASDCAYLAMAHSPCTYCSYNSIAPERTVHSPQASCEGSAKSISEHYLLRCVYTVPASSNPSADDYNYVSVLHGSQNKTKTFKSIRISSPKSILFKLCSHAQVKKDGGMKGGKKQARRKGGRS